MIVKLLSYNIRFGGRGRETELTKAIRQANPDLVVFQEATDRELVKRLAAATELPNWGARPEHSIGFLSRLEIANHEWHYPAGAKHSFLEILVKGSEWPIFGLHLSSMFSKWSERRRAREIQSLLQSIKRYENGFHVLVGDFNTLAPGELLDTRRMPTWIRALIWLSGRDIQRETIGIMKEANYADGYRFLHPDEKGYTFPVWDPHLRLDYLFVPMNEVKRLQNCEVRKDPATLAASDHFPLLATIDMS